MHDQLVQLLNGARSTAANTRKQAEDQLLSLKHQDFAIFFSALCKIIENVQINIELRFTAGVVLRNAVTFSADPFLIQNFVKITNLREELIKLVAVSNISNIVDQILGNFCVCQIIILKDASIFELVLNSCDQPYFKHMMNVFAILSTSVSPEYLNNVAQVFLALFEKKIGNEKMFFVLESFIEVFSKCKNIYRENIQKVAEHIFRIYLKRDPALFKTALKAICRIVDDYPFLNCLQSMKKEFMNILQGSSENDIVLLILDFFTILAEQEIKYGIVLVSDIVLHPILFKFMRKDDEFEYTPHKAAVSCLSMFSKTINLLHDEQTLTFIFNKLNSSDKKEQEEGVICLGCVANHTICPIDKNDKFINNSNHFLSRCIVQISSYESTCLSLNSSKFWCLGRIFETNINLFEPKLLNRFFDISFGAIKERKEDAISAALMLGTFFENLLHLDEKDVLKPYFVDLAGVLVSSCDINDFDAFDLRNALFSALSDFVLTACDESQIEVVLKIFDWYITSISESINAFNTVSADKLHFVEDLLCNQLLILSNCYLAVTETNLGNRKKNLLTTVLQILSITKQTTVFADVYQIITKLCYQNSYFSTQIDKFIPYVLRDLDSNDTFVCKSACYFSGDISNCLLVAFLPVSNLILPKLINVLQNPNLDKSIKPHVISILGDVALSMGLSFEPYCDLCLVFVKYVIELNDRDTNYVAQLSISLCTLLSSLALVLNQSAYFKSQIGVLHQFVKKTISTTKSEEVLVQCIKLMGDVVNCMGVNENKWMFELLKRYEKEEKFGKVAKEALNQE